MQNQLLSYLMGMVVFAFLGWNLIGLPKASKRPYNDDPVRRGGRGSEKKVSLEPRRGETKK